MARYGMAIDMKRCIGCNNCAMACKVENNLPNNVWWNKSVTVGAGGDGIPAGKYPNVTMSYYTLACQHCENPACVEVCPTGASYRDAETGVVLVNQGECIGCESCVNACPYEGVRTLLDDEMVYTLDYAVGDQQAKEHLPNTMEKCTFCNHRLVRGERPVCVDVCRNVARFFGDLDDPESPVSKIIAVREHEQLLADKGTGPSIYLLK